MNGNLHNPVKPNRTEVDLSKGSRSGISRRKIVYLPVGGSILLLVTALIPRVLFAEDALEDRLRVQGDMFLQGFYLERDVPLSRPEELDRLDTKTDEALPFPYDGVCNRPSWFTDNETRAAIASRCSERDDFFRTRLRLATSFTPSRFVEIVYGIEVGYLTFGRESDVSGPGTGGKGSGRTNLETQKLHMDIHTEDRHASLQTGILNYSTPEGLVLAGSGAGFLGHLDLPSLDSNLEGMYIRSEDNSYIDNDSNGFSDSNYRDIHLALARWKWSGLTSLHTEFYALYREDDNPGSEDRDHYETSRVYWAGLYANFREGPITLTVHLVGNGGEFHRPATYDDIPVLARTWTVNQLTSRGYTLLDSDGSPANTTAIDYYALDQGTGGALTDAYYHQLPRRKHRIAAGAGHIQLNFRATDLVSIQASMAAGSGRPGLEPDGSSADYRLDQFRTAGSAFQFSDIGVDSSGGYSLFPLGKLTGILAKGVSVKYQIFENLEFEGGYYSFRLMESPVMDYNAYFTKYPVYLRAGLNGEGWPVPVVDTDVRFTSHPGVRSSDRHVGEEINLRFSWKLWSGFDVAGMAAWFDIGDGYRAIKDVEYGDDLYEVSIGIRQEI